MQRRFLVRMLVGTSMLLWGLALLAWVAPALGKAVAEEKAAAGEPEKAAPAAPAKAEESAPAAGATSGKKGAKKPSSARKPAARLPNYYKDVVTEEQREKILAIQKEYTAKIDPLRKELEKLTAERDEKIEAVLTPQQKQELEKIKAAAKAARDAKAGSKGKKPTRSSRSAAPGKAAEAPK